MIRIKQDSIEDVLVPFAKDVDVVAWFEIIDWPDTETIDGEDIVFFESPQDLTLFIKGAMEKLNQL